ncbi:NfeD family protein [Candidatus Absconditicoccus praedator]|uniref:NfeD family protein n=1 Tax=Candidatus Absconditicoccus praedator TaxID=2735562 RepID=UPI001E471338|nr:NfeD family protein [Candidatus Absconditicoccus praedator]UFX82887.1 NfeD family protein [Candidatus Absconditicoccus praedator]
MSFGLYWISIGIIFIIIEVFLLTLDFLAIGAAAIITGVFVFVFDIGYDQWWITGLIFLISSTINLYVMKKYVVNWFHVGQSQQSPMSMDNAKGEKLKVQVMGGQKVVFFDGGYWNIKTDDEVNQGDTVEIVEFGTGFLKVKKIF